MNVKCKNWKGVISNHTFLGQKKTASQQPYIPTIKCDILSQKANIESGGMIYEYKRNALS